MGGISLGSLQISQTTPGLSAYLVIPGRDTVQAVILLQQVDGLAQETERGRVQGFTEGQRQTQSYSDAQRAGYGTQNPCPLALPLKSPSNFSFILSTLLQPNTCHSTFAQTLPPPLSLLPPESSPRYLIAFFLGDPVKQRGPMQLIEDAMEGHSPHLKKSTAMSRSSSKTTANLASCNGRGTT